MQLHKQTILIISPEPWGEHLLSKHHYALSLAARANQVYFLGPPGHNSIYEHPEIQVINSYFRFPGLNRYPTGLRKFLLGIEIKRLIKRIGKTPDVVWSFDPYRFQDLHLFKAKLTIYHSVDIHQTPWDEYVGKCADIILTTSDTLRNRYQHLGEKVYTIGHGVAPGFFEPDFTEEIKLRPHRPAVGYSGNLLIKYLDLQVFREIISKNEQVDFYFFGAYEPSNLSWAVPEANAKFIQYLKQREHCFLLGPKNVEQLAAGLKQMDVLLICYDSDKYPDEVANPHKTLEYLALGKVIVSSKLLSHQPHAHLMLMSNRNHELPHIFDRAIRELKQLNHPQKISERQKFAAEHVYESKIAQIESYLQQVSL